MQWVYIFFYIAVDLCFIYCILSMLNQEKEDRKRKKENRARRILEEVESARRLLYEGKELGKKEMYIAEVLYGNEAYEVLYKLIQKE